MTARILVVDDIQANVRLLEARLLAEYFQVLTASNGPDAIKICRDGHCDIVLLDVMMPDMDGFEVCKTLKSDPLTQHLPIIMVTAKAYELDRDQLCNDLGITEVFVKPFSPTKVLQAVQRCLAGRLEAS